MAGTRDLEKVGKSGATWEQTPWGEEEGTEEEAAAGLWGPWDSWRHRR